MIESVQMDQFPVFSKLSSEKKSKIAACGQIQTFSPNETIFEEGDHAEFLYGVLHGEVELSIVVSDQTLKTDIRYEDRLETRVEKTEKEIVVDAVAEGEIFGWSSLLKPSQMTATARAVGDTQAIRFAASDLEAFFESDSQTGYAFMRQLSSVISHRLRTRTDKLLESWNEAFASNRI